MGFFLSQRRRVGFAFVIGLCAALLRLASVDATFNTPDSTPGVVQYVGVDAIPTGNTATSVASVESSRTAVVGNSFQVDLVIDEIDAADGITAFATSVLYNPSVLEITGYGPYSILVPFLSGGESPPDSDGQFDLVHVNLPPPFPYGEGVGASLVFQCVGLGTSTIHLADFVDGNPSSPAGIGDSNLNLIYAQTTSDATINCTPPGVGGSVSLTVSHAGDSLSPVWYIAPSLVLASAAGVAGLRLTRRRKSDTTPR
jgi:hypothetical protein